VGACIQARPHLQPAVGHAPHDARAAGEGEHRDERKGELHRLQQVEALVQAVQLRGGRVHGQGHDLKGGGGAGVAASWQPSRCSLRFVGGAFQLRGAAAAMARAGKQICGEMFPVGQGSPPGRKGCLWPGPRPVASGRGSIV